MEWHRILRGAGLALEVCGAAAMLLGSVWAIWLAGRTARASGRKAGYLALRQTLGKAILLGLEFLVGADLLRTVTEQPSLARVSVLAVVVLIRTFLSFTLEVELEGRWPWQRNETPENREGEGPRGAS